MLIPVAVFSLLSTAAAFAQAPRPAFEAASLKPAGTSPPQGLGRAGMIQGGPGTSDPERVTAPWITLQRLLREAYGVDFDQIQGPSWMAEERYALTATLPPGATKDDLKLMLQDLLTERLHLALHHITKDFPVYEVTIAKGGAKLKENDDANLKPSVPGGNPRNQVLDKDGFPVLAPGASGMVGAPAAGGLTRLTARGVPLAGLLFQLGAQLGTITGPNTYSPGRIVDKTGLTGKYDFHVEYAGGPMIGGAFSLPAGPDGEPTGPTLIEAMEKQLGLKLTKTTAPYDVLVIDRVEKTPTEN